MPVSPSNFREIGRYEILRKVAEGGMGVVYLARNIDTGVEVALKVISQRSSSSRARFLREAQLSSRLNHPNIVRVLDFGTRGELDFFTMDFIQGEDIKRILAREGPFSPQRAASILLEVARALEYAHSQRIVHRDMKSANIILSEEGRPMITDFGIAKDLGEEGAGLTRGSASLGTPHYMAPEQVRGQRVDPRTDVYALGVILFEMISGVLPYEGEGVGMVYTKILKSPVPSLRRLRPDCPEKISRICQRAMAKTLEDRYQSAGELAEDLEKFLRRFSSSSLSKRVSLANSKRRMARVWWMVGGMGVFLLVLIFFSFSSSKVRERGDGAKGLKSSDAILPSRRGGGELEKASRVVRKRAISKSHSSGGGRVEEASKVFAVVRDLFERACFHRALLKLEGLSSRDSFLWRARCLLYLGRVEEAFQIYRRYGEDEGGELEWKILYAQLLLKRKKYGEFRKFFRGIPLISHPEVEYTKAFFYWRQKRFELALRYLRRALSLAPKRAFFYSMRLEWLFARKDYQKFFTLSRNLPEIFLENIQVLGTCGKLYMKLGRFEEANRVLRRCLKIFERDQRGTLWYTERDLGFLYHLSKSYYFLWRRSSKGGNLEKAVEYMRRFIRIFPDRTGGYYWLGLYYEGMDRNPERAISVYRKGLELDPRSEGLLKLLSQIYLKSGRYGELMGVLKSALRHYPHSAYFWNVRGYGFLGKRDFVGAAGSFAKSYSYSLSGQDRKVALQGLVGILRMYFARKDYQKIVDISKSFSQVLLNEISICYFLGLAYYHRGEGRRAYIFLRRYLRISSNIAKEGGRRREVLSLVRELERELKR